MSVRILFAGGGTGGHLYSGIAVASQLCELADTDITFVGTERGLEARVIPDSPWTLELLQISGIKGRGPLGALAGAIRALFATVRSRRLLRRIRPEVVVGIGGYASGPTVLAAALAGYPTAIIEQNVIPGFTNKFLARFVDRIYIPSESARTHFKRAGRKAIVSGNPIRMELLGSPAAPKTQDKPHVLVFGGSQGARRLNDAMKQAAGQLVAAGFTVTHQTGKNDFEAVRAAYDEAGLDIDVRAYIDDMGAQYRRADVIVCRAGASTLAEITALGKPALLVPYPHAIYNHQELNARALADAGAARWILDADLDGAALVEHVAAMASDPAQLRRMSDAARAAGHPEAAKQIAMEVLQMARKSPTRPKDEQVALAHPEAADVETTNDPEPAKAARVTHSQTPKVVRTEKGTLITLINVEWAEA